MDDNNDQTQIQTQSTPTPYCGDGIKNNNEQCDGTSDCTAACTIKTSTKTVDPKDDCPDGDFSASYYDKTCGEPTQHAAAEILDKYSIIHGDYNK